MNTPQSAPGIDIRWVLITPELATEWLKGNIRNRNIRPRVVEQYAADMKADDWAPIADPIRRTADGTLLDGQHRLNAIVRSGRSIWMAVAEGIDPATQVVMDTGKARIYADNLKIQGSKNAPTYAAVLRWVVLWERGERANLNGTAVSHRELHAAEVAYPELAEAAQFAGVAVKGMALPTSVYAMGWWLFTRIDTKDAIEFLCRISDGVQLTRDHPAYAFRERFRRDREARRAVSKATHLALLINAWNAVRDGRRLTKLQLPDGGLSGSNYPVPK